MVKYFMGIDTSAYTTSLAIVDNKGRIVFNYKKVLDVNKGKRGLRQQEAVFQHINNFPTIINDVTNKINLKHLYAVGSTDKPRNVKGSYMPVFNVSKNQGYIISRLLNTKNYNFSHQEGHIAAGLYDIKNDYSRFLSLHISGGTTEILLVEKSNNRYEADIIGGTKDISAGQLIDRIGVKLGLGFPSGAYIDDLSKKGQPFEKIPVSTQDAWINLSGPETFFNKRINEKKYSKEDISISVLECVLKSLSRALISSIKYYPKVDFILVVGGVASNCYIRSELFNIIKRETGKDIIFSKPELSTDNAVGIALMTKDAYEKEVN